MTIIATNRRGFLGAMLLASAVITGRRAYGDEKMEEIGRLKPGEFTWHPELAEGTRRRHRVAAPAARACLSQRRPHRRLDLLDRQARTYDADRRLRRPAEGPNHHSSTYNNAPMPNMNRLTWSGVALHAGNLPGYPASHGCVRLPMEFSELLFGVTHVGTPVIIAGAHTDPWELTHPGMVLSGYAEQEFEQVLSGLEGKKHPSDWTEAENFPVTSVVASSADHLIELIENDHEMAKSVLGLEGADKLGSHVFVLYGADQNRAACIGARSRIIRRMRHLAPEQNVINRINADPSFNRHAARMHPGMTLMVTDPPLLPTAARGRIS